MLAFFRAPPAHVKLDAYHRRALAFCNERARPSARCKVLCTRFCFIPDNIVGYAHGYWVPQIPRRNLNPFFPSMNTTAAAATARLSHVRKAQSTNRPSPRPSPHGRKRRFMPTGWQIFVPAAHNTPGARVVRFASERAAVLPAQHQRGFVGRHPASLAAQTRPADWVEITHGVFNPVVATSPSTGLGHCCCTPVTR